MYQLDIMRLLRTASQPETQEEELESILEQFIDHIPQNVLGVKPISTADDVDTHQKVQYLHARQALRGAVEHVYRELVAHDRRLLVDHFPFFASVCGDKPEGDWFAEIDWSATIQS